MGSMHAAEYARMAHEGEQPLDVAIGIHLQTNFFPPLPAEYVPLVREAIDAVNEADPDRDIQLPEGIYPIPRESDGITVKAGTLLRITRSENFVNSIWDME